MVFSLEGALFATIAVLGGYTAITKLTIPPRTSESMLFCTLVLSGILLYGAMIPRRDGLAERVTELPPEFIFVTGIVEEPSKNDPGRIYVVMRTEEYLSAPRIMELRYSSGLASDVKKLTQYARVKASDIPVEVQEDKIKRTTQKKVALNEQNLLHR